MPPVCSSFTVKRLRHVPLVYRVLTEFLLVIVIITTRHASWPTGQQRSSSTPVCHWPASGWCPSCGSSSSFSPPQFFARLTTVDNASAVPLGTKLVATLVMELASLRSTCPIQRHRFLVMMVSVSSCWHRAESGNATFPSDKTLVLKRLQNQLKPTGD